MKKKIFPKIKKQLQGFLADESGKISKEDVLKMSIATLGLSGFSMDANAWCNAATYASAHVSVLPHA